MYVTCVDGKVVDLRDPWYVRRDENGVWQHCDVSEAEALSIDGAKYSLSEDKPVILPTFDDDGNEIGEEAAPVAVVEYAPDGSVTIDHGASIDDLNAGVMELSDAQAQTTNDLEAALMEQADASAGTSDDLSAALMELSDITAQLMERVDALEGKKGE